MKELIFAATVSAYLTAGVFFGFAHGFFACLGASSKELWLAMLDPVLWPITVVRWMTKRL